MYVRNQIYENVDDVTNNLNDQTEQLKDINIIGKNMNCKWCKIYNVPKQL